MTVTDVETALVTDKAKEFHHVVEVVKRLADAHHNHVGDALAAISLCHGYLSEKLGGHKVALLSTYGGGAEFASHTATDLARDAEGVAVLVFH